MQIEARPHRDENSAEPDEDRREPAPADPLAEQRAGEQRDDQGPEKDHRHRLVEPQILEGQEVERRRRGHQDRAQELPAELARA